MRLASLEKIRSRAFKLGMWTCLLTIVPQLGWAAGTPSGTSISNSATLTYSVGAGPTATATGSSVPFVVDKKIDLLVSNVSGAPTSVSIGQTGAATAFTVTNLGNDPQGFNLVPALASGNPAINGTAPFTTNDFSATGLQVFVDSNANGIYEPLLDTATSIPTLASGISQTVFVVADIPGTVTAGQQSVVSLNATAVTPTTMVALSPTVGGDTPSVDVLFADGAGVIDGPRDASHSAYCALIANGVNLVLTKTVANQLDPNGGTILMPGTVLTYQIVATLTGTGTATNLVITDPLPAQTTYVAGSITVDGVAQTDPVDPPNDNTDFGITTANSITVSLGNVPSPANFVITFKATIN
jgi:uncharacterized repeat protein (TIGR01451 family)